MFEARQLMHGKTLAEPSAGGGGGEFRGVGGGGASAESCKVLKPRLTLWFTRSSSRIGPFVLLLTVLSCRRGCC